MKIISVIIRTIIGLLLLFASITYFFNLIPQPEVTGSFKTFQEGIEASVYLMPLAKTVELVCGLAYVSGKFMKLANILLVPVSLNILFINIFLAPEGTPIALFLFVGNLFMIYKDWDSYKGLFSV
jgi:uncharacterized membrane protein YphA (DoxX/SURF4 family)